jgi:hypothetical protein
MPIARIAQISDLHLTSKLTNKGRPFYKRPFLFAKAKGHAFDKLVGLHRQIERLERSSGKFDVMLATGDISTDGSRAALTNALEFIQNEELRDGSPRVATRGLNIEEQRRIFLPGNHDRFTRAWVGFQKPGDLFETTLDTRKEYPYVVGYRRAGVPNDPDQPAVLFFAFDSTPSKFAEIWQPWRKLARGRLEPGDLDTMFHQANDISNRGTVTALDGTTLNVRYSNCVRVAILHHHPLDVDKNTLMENNEDFIEYCFKAGIHLVLFGHDHKEYWLTRYGNAELPVAEPDHCVHFFCCPSASEYSSENGFYTFEFDAYSVEFCFYKWNATLKDFESGGLDFYSRFRRGAPQRFDFAQQLR